MSMKNSNRTHDLPACNAVPQTCHHVNYKLIQNMRGLEIHECTITNLYQVAA